ncbi:M-phase inducer phosphatase 3 isoform X5 [Grammomys surdaster]|uniref:M-phase inducer phosphatase 3 isoform X5 n=1 Tax=Grammomys surdaster TaxID=491861 RepID=UPI00109F871B|nr:M-phase inducer phosphatase 3 isoform X5 [Grammomys surdaster]
MSTGPFLSASEERSSVSAPSFRSKQRKMLHLLLERNTSFTIRSDFPESPGDKLHDSANLSILSGGTPKCCLDLSNLSNGEMSASQRTTSADLEENGSLDSSGPQDVQLAGKDFHQDIMKGIPVQLLCSTPNALDRGHRKKDVKCSTSAHKENENGILVESEMKYLGSPITTVPKLSQNLKLEDQEGTSEDPMECSLEDQNTKGLSLKKIVPLADMATIQMEEEDSDSEHLIGDFSKVAALLSGKFQSVIERFYVIDCRYPYEYLGGHILGALNLYSQKELHEFFLKKPVVPLDTQKRVIIVFLCEFSSERGPRMCRSLRKKDRALNQYPALYYPELYILKGGYRDFFPEYMELCEPQSYCPMLHQDHQAELLSWRSQSKAQEGERQLQEQIALLVKDVSPQ